MWVYSPFVIFWLYCSEPGAVPCSRELPGQSTAPALGPCRTAPVSLAGARGCGDGSCSGREGIPAGVPCWEELVSPGVLLVVFPKNCVLVWALPGCLRPCCGDASTWEKKYINKKALLPPWLALLRGWRGAAHSPPGPGGDGGCRAPSSPPLAAVPRCPMRPARSPALPGWEVGGKWGLKRRTLSGSTNIHFGKRDEFRVPCEWESRRWPELLQSVKPVPRNRRVGRVRGRRSEGPAGLNQRKPLQLGFMEVIKQLLTTASPPPQPAENIFLLSDR